MTLLATPRRPNTEIQNEGFANDESYQRQRELRLPARFQTKRGLEVAFTCQGEPGANLASHGRKTFDHCVKLCEDGLGSESSQLKYGSNLSPTTWVGDSNTVGSVYTVSEIARTSPGSTSKTVDAARRPTASELNSNNIAERIEARSFGAFEGAVSGRTGRGLAVIDVHTESGSNSIRSPDRQSYDYTRQQAARRLAQRIDLNPNQDIELASEPVQRLEACYKALGALNSRITQFVYVHQPASTVEIDHPDYDKSTGLWKLHQRRSEYADELNRLDKYNDPAICGVKFVQDAGPPPKVKGVMSLRVFGERKVLDDDPSKASALTNAEVLENVCRATSNALAKFPHRVPVKDGVMVAEYMDDVLGEDQGGSRTRHPLGPIKCYAVVIEFEDTNPDIAARIAQDVPDPSFKIIQERASVDGEDGAYLKGEFKISPYKNVDGSVNETFTGLVKADNVQAKCADDSVTDDRGRGMRIRMLRPLRRAGKPSWMDLVEFNYVYLNGLIRNPSYEDSNRVLKVVQDAAFYGDIQGMPWGGRFMVGNFFVDHDVASGKKKRRSGMRFLRSANINPAEGLTPGLDAATLKQLDDQERAAKADAESKGKSFSSNIYALGADGRYRDRYYSEEQPIQGEYDKLSTLHAESAASGAGVVRASDGTTYAQRDRTTSAYLKASSHEQMMHAVLAAANDLQSLRDFEVVNAQYTFNFGNMASVVDGRFQPELSGQTFRLGFMTKLKLPKERWAAHGLSPHLADESFGTGARAAASVAEPRTATASAATANPATVTQDESRYLTPPKEVILHTRESNALRKQLNHPNPLRALGLANASDAEISRALAKLKADPSVSADTPAARRLAALIEFKANQLREASSGQKLRWRIGF